MAILDTSKKPFIQDRDEQVFIGIKYPLKKSNNTEGYFESTEQTIDAVKQNVRNYLKTKKGERMMQPDLGLNLDKYIFEQISDDTIIAMQNEIIDGFGLWFPFLNIEDIVINADQLDQFGKNTINIEVIFSLTTNPNILGTVKTTVGE
jgi:phage baseplate assembly protein W